jgi:hypothetical protein
MLKLTMSHDAATSKLDVMLGSNMEVGHHENTKSIECVYSHGVLAMCLVWFRHRLLNWK